MASSSRGFLIPDVIRADRDMFGVRHMLKSRMKPKGNGFTPDTLDGFWYGRHDHTGIGGGEMACSANTEDWWYGPKDYRP